jgi:outer membrane protein assembly factor BamB
MGCTVVAVVAVLVLAGCDWSQLAYGPEHAGFSSDSTISKSAVQSGSMLSDWTATTGGAVLSTPAIAGGVAYVVSTDGRLSAFDATGAVGCAGTPKTCAPLWKSVDLGGPVSSSPAVAGGLVYAASGDARLLAFDATGSRGCSGTPKTCSPVWTAPLPGSAAASPTVVGGRVFAVSASGGADALSAFDATSGAPLWAATVVDHSTSGMHTRSPATVAAGVVYAGFAGAGDNPPEAPQARVLAFDAAGTTNCSGSPVTCQPLWETRTATDQGEMGMPAVAGGILYASGFAFDAAGANGCSGVPKRCDPLWSMTGTGDTAVSNSVAIRGGAAFDSKGVTNCSGTPKVCLPLWSGATGSDTTSAASIANGVVYVEARDSSGGTVGTLSTFDIAGTINCSGTPKVCQPLWSVATGGAGLPAPPMLSAPAISSGRVYVGGEDGKLSVFALERTPPTVSLLAPANGDTVSETTVVAASAADNVGVSRVEFRLSGNGVNDALVGTATSNETGWIYSWNTNGLADAAYALSAVAFDIAGNQTRSEAVTVNVDNHKPTTTPETVSADSLPTVQVTGIVWAQALVGNTLYATGSFTKARPAGAAAGANEVTRTDLLAYDITTGQLLPFNHTLNGEGRAITATPDGSRIYVGGSFTTVDGVAHPRLAAFNTNDGSLVTSFSAGVNNTVRAVTATNTAVYAGGAFSAASSGSARGRLVAFNSAGALLSWAPSADLTVSAMVMAPDQTRVILGGSFDTINGSTYHALAAADATTGAPLPWGSQSDSYLIQDDGVNSGITGLSTNGSKVFVTGFNFMNVAKPGGLEGRASISPVDGTVSWISDCHGDSYASVPIGNVLYSVGHAHDCQPAGAFPETNPLTWHRALAETTFATHVNGPGTNGYWAFEGVPAPTQLDWYPEVNTGSFSGSNQGGWSIVGNAGYVAMGGEFTQVNGVGQQALARFAIRSLAPNAIGPEGYPAHSITAGAANASGQVPVSWRATWDRDDAVLSYRLYRDGGTTPIFTADADSRFWRVPDMAFTDSGLAPGSTHTYRLVVSDPYGNTVTATT